MDITFGEASSRGTRWVCPNDRHLALRAKLRTGWSVKTGSLDSRWGDYQNSYTTGGNRRGQSFVLTEEERQTIIQVIRRAEALDLSEQERVGRLVERLENMKRNVCIVTSTRLNERKNCGSRCSGGTRCVCSCALCGEKFGAVLGATPSLCKDCRKYICQKCGIETSGPNSSFSNVSTSMRGVSVMTKFPQERTAMQRIVKRSSSNAQRQFLCRICAETREMWKKSGAWFFKGMPKYILPEKKERGWSRIGHKTSTWTVGGKSLESAEPQDSSSDEDTTRRLAIARGHSTSSTNLPGNQDNTTVKALSPLSNSSQPCSNMSKPSTGKRSNGLSPLGNREEPSDRFDRSTLSIVSHCGHLSPTGSITTLRSRTNEKVYNGPQVEQRVSFEDEILVDEKANKSDTTEDVHGDTRRIEFNSVDRLKSSQVQSLRSNSSTTPTTPTTPTLSAEGIQEQLRTHEKSIDRESSRSCSDQESFGSSTRTNNQVDLPRLQSSEYPHETGQNYGTLEVSLRYDPAAQCLQCKVERARGLKPMDIHGLADPFCKLNILPTGTATTSKRLQTKTVHKTRDPEFNETVNFYGTTETDVRQYNSHKLGHSKKLPEIRNGKALHVLILQDDPSGQDFLGEAKFPLHKLQPYQTTHYNVLLQEQYPVDNENTAWGLFSSGRGQIQLSLSYCTRRQALMVIVHRATNLLPMDSNGFSDPFVKLCLAENTTNNHRQHRVLDYSIARNTARKLVSKKHVGRNSQSTSVKWKTLNPEWNEEFVFATRLTDLMKLTLCLTVWDKDFGKSNDYLGGLELSCNSKGARLRHWVDAIKFPNHRHRAWHNLTETIIPPDL